MPYEDLARDFEFLFQDWATFETNSDFSIPHRAGLKIIEWLDRILKMDAQYHSKLISHLKQLKFKQSSHKEVVDSVYIYFLPLVNWLRPVTLPEILPDTSQYPKIDLDTAYNPPSAEEIYERPWWYFFF